MPICQRTLLAALAIASVSLGAGAGEPPTVAAADDPLAPLAWLAGSCWTGTFADGRTQDLVCYEWMMDGKFLRSRHRIVGGKGPYSGETIFGRAAGGAGLEFTYFNSLGGVSRGAIEPFAGGLRFPAETVQQGGASFELRSEWRRDGEDRYRAVTEKRVDGAWRPSSEIRFVRTGPATDWLRPDPREPRGQTPESHPNPGN